jgi:hypothetical protein
VSKSILKIQLHSFLRKNQKVFLLYFGHLINWCKINLFLFILHTVFFERPKLVAYSIMYLLLRSLTRVQPFPLTNMSAGKNIYPADGKRIIKHLSLTLPQSLTFLPRWMQQNQTIHFIPDKTRNLGYLCGIFKHFQHVFCNMFLCTAMNIPFMYSFSWNSAASVPI